MERAANIMPFQAALAGGVCERETERNEAKVYLP